MHILVAEDDPDIADLIALYVGKAGWTPHTVGNGSAALDFVKPSRSTLLSST